MGDKRPYGINGAARFFLIFMSIFLLGLAGCGNGSKKEGAAGKKAPAASVAASAKEATPPGHPGADKAGEEIAKASHAAIKSQKEIKISDEVRKKWKEVKIKITDASSKEAASLKLKVGSSVKLTDDGYALKVEVFVPDYAIVGDHIESRSNEPKNSAALVDILKGGKVVTHGWIFKDFPEFNSYNNRRFQLVLVGP